MASLINTSVIVKVNETTTTYFYSPKHRGKATHEISVWSVGYPAELACFTQSLQSGWLDVTCGWGIIKDGRQGLAVLGYNLKSPELVIARFVVDQNQWHGYPADVRHKPGDKPTPPILSDWLNNGHISKAFRLRIQRGQV